MSTVDVIRRFKRVAKPLQFQKIGHLGTLDPFAEGVVIIGVNGACRLSDWAQEMWHKTYLAEGVLHKSSNTGDCTGEIVDHPQIDLDFDRCWSQAIEKFVGEYWQRPHQFSAAKHQGRPLYEYARQGKEIEKPAVKREIFNLELKEFDQEKVVFKTQVNKGTYIRVLFEDMAREWQTKGHLNRLIRLYYGPLSSEDSINSHEFDLDCIREKAICPSSVLDFPEWFLQGTEEKIYRNGGFLEVGERDRNPWGWVKTESGQLLGLGSMVQNEIRPKINFSIK